MNVSYITIIRKVVVEHTMATKVAMVVTIMVAMVGATRFTVAAFLDARTNNGYLILRQLFYLNIIPYTPLL
jgi:hypothetical protein